MQSETSIIEQIRNLEQRLLNPEVRSSSEELEQLLSDDFIEFGSSGRTYDREQVILSLQHQRPGHFSIGDFQVRLLAPGVVLAIYRVVQSSKEENEREYSLRSSVWRFKDGRWQIVFHQGTRTDDCYNQAI